MSEPVESDDDPLWERSDYLIERAWDDIIALHLKHEAPIAVYAIPNARISSKGKSQTAIALAVIPPDEFDRMCAQIVELNPDDAEVLAAPHRRELVKIVYVEEPSGRTRVLTLPVLPAPGAQA